ncbi:bifunctional DNA primase/polymerase [Sinorhizobium meliloti]|uniref:bifunctional DNA primase/polymerase n=1 Tax=Rhizobium meliloti TaxID=382 RepID=UPI001F29D3DA|nr:bifunctional DNA primase/polymerase [Sinorhizobium meliloti]
MNSTAANLQPDLSVEELRLTLFRNGYSPVLARGKISDVAGWRTPVTSAEEVAQLTAANPTYKNTGILCGSVVAVDIDAQDPDTAAGLTEIAERLPGADIAIRRVGKAPKVMLLFRATEIRKKSSTAEYTVNGLKCQVEVMGDGQQIVAFGIHPETQRPYEWLGPSPLDVPLADLPEITPEAIDGFVAEATDYLNAHGRLLRARKAPTEHTRTGSETFWQRVNSAALDNTDRWVPSLFSSARKEPGTGSWRVTSKELGRELEEDISIHRDGIQDFGLEQSETPLSLVEKWGGAPSPKDAAFWLCERLGRDPVEFGWEHRDIGARMTLGSLGRFPAAANDNEQEDDQEDDPVIPQAGGLSEHLCYPPGAVGDFARFIVGCSRFPSPHLSLVASLAFTAGLIGRRYRGPTGLRSNIYIVGLAESGFGKDVTIRATAALADSTSWGHKVSENLFSDQIRSLPGLAGKLRKSPSAVVIQDEFGRWLAEHTGRNVASHRAEITASLMELTGAPAGFWGGQEKAGGNIPRILAPCLTIHGVSTPSTFWNALTSGNISEGLLGRLVLVDVGNAEPVKVRRPPNSIDDIPPALSEQVAALLGLSAGKYTGTFCALSAKSDEKPHPIMTAEWAPGVDDLFEDFDDRIRGMRKTIDPQYRPILNRVGENAARLALIVAVGCDPKEPVITSDIQTWANAVAEHSLQVILRGATDNIADNDRAAEYLRVRQQVVRRGQSGITLRDIVKNLRGSIDKRRLEDILAMLRQAREIHLAKLTMESGQSKVRFWSAESLPDGAAIISLEAG